MREVEKIRFNFASFETSDWIACEYLDAFVVRGVRKEIKKISINFICELNIAKHVEMELYIGADKCSGTVNPAYGGSLFKRMLLKKDLLTMEIAYKDKTTEVVYVPWGGESEAINEYQESFMARRGGMETLKLVLSSRKTTGSFQPVMD